MLPLTRLFALALTCLIVASGQTLPGAAAETEVDVATPKTRYEDMLGAFERGDFANAKAVGEKLVAQGSLSPQVFQFLGNTHYRLGEMGTAALYYRRAALFPPSIPEVRQNLVHIRDRTGNLSFAKNEFREQYSGFLSRSRWFVIAVSAAWIAALSFVLTLFLRRSSGLRVFMVFIRVLAVLTALFAGMGWYWRPTFAKIEKIAIITEPNTKAYTAATVTAGTVTALPPGSEVRRLEDRGQWTYVEIPGEDLVRRGWVLNSTFEPLWPYQKGYLE